MLKLSYLSTSLAPQTPLTEGPEKHQYLLKAGVPPQLYPTADNYTISLAPTSDHVPVHWQTGHQGAVRRPGLTLLLVRIIW